MGQLIMMNLPRAIQAMRERRSSGFPPRLDKCRHKLWAIRHEIAAEHLNDMKKKHLFIIKHDSK